jgi:predicted acyltransferase
MATPETALSQRLVSLDAFRGLTIAAMILVNNPGSWGAVYPPLAHAEWHGWTPTDLIFPFFLFIVGVSMSFSFAKRLEASDRSHLYRQVFRRSAILYGLGLLLSAFPDFDIGNLRYVGVLPRIALAYLATSLIVLNLSRRAQVWVFAGILLVYWGLMKLVPVPGFGAGVLTPEGNLAGWIDSVVLPGRLYQGTWDPEGLLSTLPAIATALSGVFTGYWLRSGRDRLEIVRGMMAAGSVAVALGLVWDLWFPINKNLWTSSYVLFTSGAALVCLAVCYWLIDVRGYRKWAQPAVVFGVNAIAVFVLSGLLTRLLIRIHVPADPDPITLKQWIFETFFASWASPMNASLAYAVTYLLFWWAMIALLYRRKIFIKI